MNEKGLRKRVQRAVSSGGVVYRVVAGKVETALCGRNDPVRWSLPKGTPDQGESLEQTALREVREETGLLADIEAPIGNINYWFVIPPEGTHCNKTVHFYLMAHKGGATSDHDPEFDQVQWFDPETALKSLIYANEVKVMEQALTMIEEKLAGSNGTAAR